MGFNLIYPDVLGAISGGERIGDTDLQYVVGIFPLQAFLNQPVEIVIPIQNMVDQKMKVIIAVRLPKMDKNGNPVYIEIDKTEITLNIKPGEVGVLRVPLVARPPTKASRELPIRVAVRFRTSEPGIRVRPPDGGPPPSVLTLSPFRLQVLRDVPFVNHRPEKSFDVITATFDIASKQMPRTTINLKHSYESLWTSEQVPQERRLARERLEDARYLAQRGAHGTIFWHLRDAIEDRFAKRGMPLHPGESRSIAKMMSYTVDDAPMLEQSLNVEGMRWFRTLCQVLAHDETLVEEPRGDIFAEHLLDAILFDSIGLAFKIVQQRVDENLGDTRERINYAYRVLVWLAGTASPDLNYVYLPLVLGGFLVSRLVTLDVKENPWIQVDELREALNGRIRLAHGETIVVFEMLDMFLEEAERTLMRQRIERPRPEQ